MQRKINTLSLKNEEPSNLVLVLTEKLNMDTLLMDFTIYNLAVSENRMTQKEFFDEHMRNSANKNLKILMALLLLFALEVQCLRNTHLNEYSYSIQLAIFAFLIPINSNLFYTPVKNTLSWAKFFTAQEINVDRIQDLRQQLIDIKNISEAYQIDAFEKNVDTISKAKIGNCLELSYLAAGQLFYLPEVKNLYVSQVSLEQDHVIILLSHNKLDDNIYGKKLHELDKDIIVVDLWYKVIQRIENLPASHERLKGKIVNIYYSLQSGPEKLLRNIRV